MTNQIQSTKIGLVLSRFLQVVQKGFLPIGHEIITMMGRYINKINITRELT